MASGHYSQAFDHSLPRCWLVLEIVMMVVVLVNYDEHGDDYESIASSLVIQSRISRVKMTSSQHKSPLPTFPFGAATDPFFVAAA